MKRSAMCAAVAALLAVVPASAQQPVDPSAAADLVLRNGKIFVADPANTIVTALAIRDERIIAAGTDAQVASLIGARTRVIDLAGGLVTPGMNDAHLHFAVGGITLLEVRLGGATSLAEIEKRVREGADRTSPGEWVRGRGWDHTLLPAAELGTGGWPTKAALDRAAPNHPVFLKRVDGHTGWVNSRALQLAGITAATPDPPGGEIVRDPVTREPTGILKETAWGLVERAIPPFSDARVREGIRAATTAALSSGVTSVQTDLDSIGVVDMRAYQAMRAMGELKIRIYGWLPLSRENINRFAHLGIHAPFGDDWLRVGLLKTYTDGSLGSRSAWMLEPYSDDPSTRGIQRISQASLDSLVIAADAAGLQLAIHAIGDGGNRMALDALERARRMNGRRDSRHRIEHAQIIDALDIPRFKALGVVASMQPTHATSDMRWVETRIGRARAEEGAYVWRKLLKAGAPVMFGTDFAVEPIRPVEGLYSAVTRQSRDEPGTPAGGWLPAEKLTMAEAIRLYTAGSAYGEYQEQEKGTLERGRLADLVWWDHDLLTISPLEILQTAPLLTVVGGKIVYEADTPRIAN